MSAHPPCPTHRPAGSPPCQAVINYAIDTGRVQDLRTPRGYTLIATEFITHRETHDAIRELHRATGRGIRVQERPSPHVAVHTAQGKGDHDALATIRDLHQATGREPWTARQHVPEVAVALLCEPGVLACDGTQESHQAIINLLDRTVNGRFYAKEPFQATIDTWAGTPLIYAAQHPDFDAFDVDPSKELARLAALSGKPARVVGKARNVRVEVEGHPRLMGDLPWIDAEVDALHAQGKLSLSSGIWCPKDGQNRLYGAVKPHHILLFEETTTAQPGDRGSVILNQRCDGGYHAR